MKLFVRLNAERFFSGFAVREGLSAGERNFRLRAAGVEGPVGIAGVRRVVLVLGPCGGG